MAVLEVVEGESAAARENQVIAALTLPLAPGPPGSPAIKASPEIWPRTQDLERKFRVLT